jgi:hypothetical protein
MVATLVQVTGLGLLGILLFAIGCGEPASRENMQSEYSRPVQVGRIETPDIQESSGLSASECQDVLWTHNDAGNGPLIYAMDLKGKHLGVWRVTGASSTDWESIATYRDASGTCQLFIGDIGDNDQTRPEILIYRIPEPTIDSDSAISSSAKPLSTPAADVMRIKYTDGCQNAETLLVHPKTGDVYIVTKAKQGPAAVHRVKPIFGNATAAITEKVATVSLPTKPEGLITGGSLSPDGSRAMLCDVQRGYELKLPAASSSPDDLWKQKPIPVDIGERKQGEGVSYGRDGLSLYATSEKKNAPIYMIKRKS